MKVLALYNIKGGVGKTTTAVNLAYLAAREGRRTLLWDLDPQAAATFLFRVRPRVKGGSRALVTRSRPIAAALKATDFEGLDLLPADFSYRNMDLELDDTGKRTRRLGQLMRSLSGDYDIAFLDCPPSVSLVSENVLQASDLLLVPLIPSALSLRTLDQLRSFVSDTGGNRSGCTAMSSPHSHANTPASHARSCRRSRSSNKWPSGAPPCRRSHRPAAPQSATSSCGPRFARRRLHHHACRVRARGASPTPALPTAERSGDASPGRGARPPRTRYRPACLGRDRQLRSQPKVIPSVELDVGSGCRLMRNETPNPARPASIGMSSAT
jgi:chromosome partitioning protein